ncbi:nucleotidyltransferase family protein [Pseudomonas triclosanedens]|nr:nucleotidyltransferase family protein [Pseudomonas triclosanedens]
MGIAALHPSYKLAPQGTDDLFGMRVRPTERFRAKPHLYHERLAAKNWPARWPKLRVESL